MKLHPEYPTLLQFDLFAGETRIEHFSTTRGGGVSSGEFESLNLGNFSDDDPVKIAENREILSRMFFRDVSNFIIPHQTHGAMVLTIDRQFLSSGLPDKIEQLYGIDATITREKGIFLCATTADCVPILLFDKSAKVIAAIHAGWRGTAARIVEKTIRRMNREYGCDPKNVIAGIGPAIGMKNYEVGEEVIAEFERNGFDLSPEKVCSRPGNSGKAHINLQEINFRELTRLGVPESGIETSGFCTYENGDLFFSARRQSIHSGRMLTGIALRDI